MPDFSQEGARRHLRGETGSRRNNDPWLSDEICENVIGNGFHSTVP
jgi:hypothetical protein